jgi:hypothetical protein
MALSKKIGLILSNNLKIDDYDLLVDNKKYSVCFHDGNSNHYDLVVTDKKPNDLSAITAQQKDCHGTVLIINKILNTTPESQYESIFTETQSDLKYRSIKNLTPDSIKAIINAELMKQLAKNDKVSSLSLLFNKYTFRNLLAELLGLSFILLPYLCIILYLGWRFISKLTGLNPSLYLLCYLGDYNPNCKNDLFGEIKLLALLYSVCNLIFYYNYILSIFDNIDYNIFQLSPAKKRLHKWFECISPIILFISALIIFKSLFIFKYDLQIAEDIGLNGIGIVFDKYIPLLKDDFIIYYFLCLDLSLWFMTRNYLSTSLNNISSNNKSIIKDAQKSFLNSVFFNIFIFVFTAILFNFLKTDSQGKLAVQLIFLQSVYLYINIATIIYDFKHK